MTPPPRPLPRLPAAGLALLAGVMLGLSFPELGLWPLAWLGLVPLLVALRGRGFLGGLWLGWLAGAVTTAIGYSWVAELLARYARLPWPVAALGLALSSAAHGLPLALSGALAAWLWKRRDLRPMLALPPAIVAGELLVPMVFPWLLAVSQQDVLAIVQLADVIGARGLSAVVALGGAAIYELAAAPTDRRTRRAVLAAALAIAAVCGYGAARLLQVEHARDRAPRLAIGLVQPNLSIEQKHDPAQRGINLALHQDMSAELERAGAELVVWPESAYPYYVPREATHDAEGNRAVIRGFRGPVIFGALSVDQRERRRYNSTFLLDRNGRLVGPADKVELLVFGEYIPFYDDLAWLRETFPEAWNFTPGAEPGVLESGPLRAGVLNCYEDILPGHVRALARRRVNLLVNVTNDAWFGDTAEPAQHAASARFRAVEHRVDLVRAVNSGISTVVASTGAVVTRSEVGVRAAVLADVRLTEAGTIYTALGDSFAWALTCVIPVVAFWRRRRQ